MSTRAISAARLLFHRQAGLLPGGEAAGEIDHVGKAVLAQQCDARSRAIAVGAMQDHRLRLVLVQLARAPREVRQRQAARAEDVAAGVLRRRTQVDHHRIVAIHHLRRLQRVHSGAAHALAHQRPQQHAARNQGDDDEEDVLGDEFHESRRIIIQRRRKLVLLRRGESGWNRENRFTGWTDVDLSAQGVEEARAAGRLLKAEGLAFDLAFTSLLKRAIRTLHIALEELDQLWLPVAKDWRLNERHYGALQGLNKAEMAAKFGEAQVLVWRRSYDTPPPALEASDARYEGSDPRYRGVAVPRSECLKDTVARVLPCWNEVIAPEVRSGQRVLVAAHGNSLRALIKHLDSVSDADIVALNVPTGVPLVYELDDALRPLKHYYLGDQAEIAARMAAVAAQGKAKT